MHFGLGLQISIFQVDPQFDLTIAAGCLARIE